MLNTRMALASVLRDDIDRSQNRIIQHNLLINNDYFSFLMFDDGSDH